MQAGSLCYFTANVELTFTEKNRNINFGGHVIIANVSLGSAPLGWAIVAFAYFTRTGSQDTIWHRCTIVPSATFAVSAPLWVSSRSKQSVPLYLLQR